MGWWTREPGSVHCVQEVAIKMLYQSDQKAQEAFLREISMLKYASRDRNVVQFYGVTIQSNGIWLITEHMEARSDHRPCIVAKGWCSPCRG